MYIAKSKTSLRQDVVGRRRYQQNVAHFVGFQSVYDLKYVLKRSRQRMRRILLWKNSHTYITEMSICQRQEVAERRGCRQNVANFMGFHPIYELEYFASMNISGKHYPSYGKIIKNRYTAEIRISQHQDAVERRANHQKMHI